MWHEKFRRKHAVPVFCVLWVVLGVIAWGLVRSGNGYWIELFNGATWPPQFLPTKDVPKPEYGFCFYVILSLRALLNLGVVFAAAVAAYLIFTGRMEGLIMSKLNSVYRTSNVMLIERVLQLLEDEKVDVPEKVEELVRMEAREFGSSDGGSHFRERVKDAAGTPAH